MSIAAGARLALRGPPGWVAIALTCALATGAASQASFRGRPLVDVLEEFQRRGLNLIFSSAVVGSELVIVEEPAGDDPRRLLDQILPPLGLKAEAGPGGSVLIVRGPRAGAAPTEPPLPRLIEDVVVIPSRRELVERNVDGTRRVEATAAALIPVPGSDPSRMVSLLPGVASSEASATFHARGSASRDASLILDGLELYDPYHLSGFQSPFSFVDGRLVDSVDLVAGGFTADRGDRTGGFLAIATALPDGRPETELELGTLNGRVAFRAPTPIGPVVISGRYWYPAAADAIVFAEDGLQPKFGDVYVKAGLLTTPRTVLTAHALLASEAASLTEPDGHERVDADGSSVSLWVRAIRSWSESVTMDTVVSAGRMGRARMGVADPDDQPVAVEDDRRVGFAGVRSEASWVVSHRSLLRGGIEVRALQAEFEHVAGATPPLALKRDGASLGAFASYRKALGHRVTAELGVRWDRQTYTGGRQWSPRLNVAWQAGPRDEFRVAAGRYAQSLRIHELRIEDGETDYRPAEISRQLDVSYAHTFGRSFKLRVDAYVHRLGRIQPRAENLFHPMELFPEVEPDRVLVAPESARLRGLEVSAAGDAGSPLSWWASYTWSRATDRIDGADVPRSWDQTHAATAFLGYRWASGWFLGGSVMIHTGWPTTPIAAEAVEQPDGSTEIVAVNGPRNSARFPTYSRLDLKTGRTVRTSKGELRFELSIVNLTDRRNACCVDEVDVIETPGGAAVIRQELDYWMGITPSLQAAWKF